MGLFDAIQNIVGGVSDAASNVAGDALGGLTDNQVVNNIQDQATNITEQGTDAVQSVTESGQAALDDVTKHLGL